jgi:arylformamidase
MSDIANRVRSAVLEREYDFRWRHPDREAILARYAAESDEVVRRRTAVLDVTYGKGERERVDVFPAEHPASPVHVFIHGGYWRSHRKEDYRFVAEAGRSAGMTTFVIEYDLAPAVDIDAIVAQVDRAVGWVRENARRFNGNPDRLVVSGHSAGGHLAAMLALADKVDGCLAISGIFDLEPISRTSIDDDLKLDPDIIGRNSPLRLARPGRAPIVIAYGLGETAQFAQQARSFAAALARVGRRHRLLAVPHLHHYDIVLELGRPDRGLAMALCGLVGKNA